MKFTFFISSTLCLLTTAHIFGNERLNTEYNTSSNSIVDTAYLQNILGVRSYFIRSSGGIDPFNHDTIRLTADSSLYTGVFNFYYFACKDHGKILFHDVFIYVNSGFIESYTIYEYDHVNMDEVLKANFDNFSVWAASIDSTETSIISKPHIHSSTFHSESLTKSMDSLVQYFENGHIQNISVILASPSYSEQQESQLTYSIEFNPAGDTLHVRSRTRTQTTQTNFVYRDSLKITVSLIFTEDNLTDIEVQKALYLDTEINFILKQEFIELANQTGKIIQFYIPASSFRNQNKIDLIIYLDKTFDPDSEKDVRKFLKKSKVVEKNQAEKN